jgi:hypothetical protein
VGWGEIKIEVSFGDGRYRGYGEYTGWWGRDMNIVGHCGDGVQWLEMPKEPVPEVVYISSIFEVEALR